ncbi:hypothetical protein [Taro reovirus 1]|nr:hypothetical protein [Taro reovirus 1]
MRIKQIGGAVLSNATFPTHSRYFPAPSLVNLHFSTDEVILTPLLSKISIPNLGCNEGNKGYPIADSHVNFSAAVRPPFTRETTLSKGNQLMYFACIFDL